MDEAKGHTLTSDTALLSACQWRLVRVPRALAAHPLAEGLRGRLGEGVRLYLWHGTRCACLALPGGSRMPLVHKSAAVQ